MMSLLSYGVPAVVGSLITGLVSALFAYRVSLKKESRISETRLREELKSLIREERSAHSECLAEVRSMRAELTDARVLAARWESRCDTIERTVHSLHAQIASALGLRAEQ